MTTRTLSPSECLSKEQENHHNIISSSSSSSSSYLQTSLITLGATVFFGLHGAMLFSLPSVLRSRGAPYLPTFQKELDSIFYIIKAYCGDYIHTNRTKMMTHRLLLPAVPTWTRQQHQQQQQQSCSSSIINHKSSPFLFTFIDLGSGDGRLVFRAARENLFHTCIGYEINPVLHLWVTLRRFIQAYKYRNTTQFYLQDLWTINLSSYHNDDSIVVVTVYGLYPIMKRLGKKLQEELPSKSIVISLFFEIPGWKSTPVSSIVNNTTSTTSNTKISSNIYIYIIPSCWQ